MIGILRLVVLGSLVLGVVYFLISIYSRSVQREKLENKWDAEVKTGDRDAYINDGMRAYENSVRIRLILLVFVVPVSVIAGLVYVINFL